MTIRKFQITKCDEIMIINSGGDVPYLIQIEAIYAKDILNKRVSYLYGGYQNAYDKGYNEIKIDAMTIHKSKGLTYDEVILLGLTSGFPNNKRGFWMLNVFRNEDVNEGISFAEERRVFYVAMTRTLNHLYMFVPKDVVKRSPYIKEICEIIANSTVDK